MQTEYTSIAGCHVVDTDKHADDRGFFVELFQRDNYAGIVNDLQWKQANWSHSEANVVRGVHVAQYSKLVTCVSGAILDLVVDLRPQSPTYLRHEFFRLNPGNHRQVLVPPGCGHGFYSMVSGTNVVYLTSELFAEFGETTVHYMDPELAIEWPGVDHIVSKRDAEAPRLRDLR